jgi:hypothetical protein
MIDGIGDVCVFDFVLSIGTDFSVFSPAKIAIHLDTVE